MTETEIQKQIVAYLELAGALVFRMNAGRGRNNQRLCPPGTPDLLVIGRGGPFWVEVKTPSGKLSEDQRAMHKTLLALGQQVMVARSVEDIQFVDN